MCVCRRLIPLTANHGDEPSPKALLPIANRPMIEYPLSWLEQSGVTGSWIFPLLPIHYSIFSRRLANLSDIASLGDVKLHPIRHFLFVPNPQDRLANIRRNTRSRSGDVYPPSAFLVADPVRFRDPPMRLRPFAQPLSYTGLEQVPNRDDLRWFYCHRLLLRG